jgi:PhnB protein
MQAQPYLFFNGRCEEALDWYKDAIGARVTAMMRYGEHPPGEGAPSAPADKVMHAEMMIGDTKVMASDGQCSGTPAFGGFSLALGVPEEAEAKRLFGRLAEGGEVAMPLAKTFFSPAFGVLKDRFGVGWMVIADGPGG